jgi:hypothetical protein
MEKCCEKMKEKVRTGQVLRTKKQAKSDGFKYWCRLDAPQIARTKFSVSLSDDIREARRDYAGVAEHVDGGIQTREVPGGCVSTRLPLPYPPNLPSLGWLQYLDKLILCSWWCLACVSC